MGVAYNDIVTLFTDERKTILVQHAAISQRYGADFEVVLLWSYSARLPLFPPFEMKVLRADLKKCFSYFQNTDNYAVQ